MSNKDVFGANIPVIERAIGYVFSDKSLLRQAFTRTSWCNEHGGDKYQSNEVLEFFGDSALSIAIVSFLLGNETKRCDAGIRTELGEGDFSNIKSKLSDKTNLSASMAKLGLQKYLLLGEGDEKLGIASEPSVMEDLFESIIGAVYIDSDKDIKTVTKVVAGMLDMSVYASKAASGVSPKNALQEWCASKKRRLPSPVYKTLSETGPDHKKVYERGVYIGDRLVASATGKNQKTADTLAAKEALEILRSESEASTTEAKTNEPEAKAKNEAKAAEPEAKAKNEAKAKTKTEAKNEPKAALTPVRESSQDKKTSASAELKRIADKAATRGPVFRDLGLIAEDEHSVECSFMGERSIATAPTRREAKERAAEIVLGAIRRK